MATAVDRKRENTFAEYSYDCFLAYFDDMINMYESNPHPDRETRKSRDEYKQEKTRRLKADKAVKDEENKHKTDDEKKADAERRKLDAEKRKNMTDDEKKAEKERKKKETAERVKLDPSSILTRKKQLVSFKTSDYGQIINIIGKKYLEEVNVMDLADLEDIRTQNPPDMPVTDTSSDKSENTYYKTAHQFRFQFNIISQLTHDQNYTEETPVCIIDFINYIIRNNTIPYKSLLQQTSINDDGYIRARFSQDLQKFKTSEYVILMLYDAFIYFIKALSMNIAKNAWFNTSVILNKKYLFGWFHSMFLHASCIETIDHDMRVPTKTDKSKTTDTTDQHITPKITDSDPPSDKTSSKRSDKTSLKRSDKTSDQSSDKTSSKPSDKSSDPPSDKSSSKPSDKTSSKPSDTPSDKSSDKTSSKPSDKSSDKLTDKTTDKPDNQSDKSSDKKRTISNKKN
jgi:hypothetical protein